MTKCILSNADWLKGATRWREYFVLLCSALVRPYLQYSPVLAQPLQKGCGETGTSSLEGYRAGYLENMIYKESGGSWTCSVWHRAV